MIITKVTKYLTLFLVGLFLTVIAIYKRGTFVAGGELFLPFILPLVSVVIDELKKMLNSVNETRNRGDE